MNKPFFFGRADNYFPGLFLLLVLLALPGIIRAQNYLMPTGTGVSSITTCSGTLRDNGGTGNYSNNQNSTLTIFPGTPGQYVRLNFSQFLSEYGYDYMIIYNGNSTASPVLNLFAGDGGTPIVTSSAPDGSLTLTFFSDNIFTDAGFTASISCVSTPNSVCGKVIYDAGGPSGNYADDQNIVQVFYPDNPCDKVKITFTAFNLENGFDFLDINDGAGNVAGFPLVGSYTGTTLPPSFTSTAANGALTISFYSDFIFNNPGFAATITCVPGSSVNITQDPQSQPVCLGQNFTLSTTATGANQYSWFFGTPGTGTLLQTGTSPTYTVTAATALNAGNYYVVAQNTTQSPPCNTDTSAVAVITIGTPQASSISANICSGASYTFNGTTYTTGGTFTGTFLGANGCDSVVTLTLSVSAGPAAIISYNGAPFCTSGGTAAVTQTGTGGGTYTAAPAGLTINPTSGLVTPASSTPNTYTVTYTIPASGGCPTFTTTASITINAAPTATIAYTGGPFCKSGTPISVTQTGTTGGTYSAAPAGLSIDASTGAVTLTTSSVNTYTVTYTIAAVNGCAAFSTTTTLTISLSPTAAIAYNGAPFCTSGGTAPVTLTGTTGGTFTALPAGLSINAATGLVTPSTSTPGPYTVTYTIPAANGCAAVVATASISINAAPAATIAYPAGPFCTSGTPVSATQTGSTGGTYSAAPAGLSINATTGTVTLSTSLANTYTVTYTIPAANGCAAFSTTASITVSTAPTATIAYNGSPYCTSGGTVTVSQTGTIGGTYTAAPAGLSLNASTGAVTLASSSPGSYTITYSIAAANGCTAFSTTASIAVSGAPTAGISYAGSPFCTNSGTGTVSQTGTIGGTYTATPVGLGINAITGAIKPGNLNARNLYSDLHNCSGKWLPGGNGNGGRQHQCTDCLYASHRNLPGAELYFP